MNNLSRFASVFCATLLSSILLIMAVPTVSAKLDSGFRDSDRDGIPDYIEEKFGADPLITDTDGDGLTDSEEMGSDAQAPLDTDQDKQINMIDVDDDGDGIPTVIELRLDTDDDGLKDYLDPDSDNDGIPDGEESGADLKDHDNDGIANAFDADLTGHNDPNGDGIDPGFVLADKNGNGIADLREKLPATLALESPKSISNPPVVEVEEKPMVVTAGINHELTIVPLLKGAAAFIGSVGKEWGLAAIQSLDVFKDKAIATLKIIPVAISDRLSAFKGHFQRSVEPADTLKQLAKTDADSEIPAKMAALPDFSEDASEHVKSPFSAPLGDEVEGQSPSFQKIYIASQAEQIGTQVGGSADAKLVEKEQALVIAQVTPQQGTKHSLNLVPKQTLAARSTDDSRVGAWLVKKGDRDGDGIPDKVEIGNDPKAPLDRDSDGIPDYLDPDDDGDGIATEREFGSDRDGDGVPDHLDHEAGGYFYCANSGRILKGIRQFRVYPRSKVKVLDDGNHGYYRFNPKSSGVYRLQFTLPKGVSVQTDHHKGQLYVMNNGDTVKSIGYGQDGANPEKLAGFNPENIPAWYSGFYLEKGAPMVINHNIPLTGDLCQ